MILKDLLYIIIYYKLYIDGLSDILNKSTICSSLGGKRINHLLYADDLCIVSLSSAGLQQLLSICDQYCASHSLTFNVRKSVCMFFKSKMNKLCDNVPVVLHVSGNNIEFVHETKIFRRDNKFEYEDIF